MFIDRHCPKYFIPSQNLLDLIDSNDNFDKLVECMCSVSQHMDSHFNDMVWT